MEENLNNDFKKMFEKASEMSKLFNLNNDNSNNMDIESMFKIMQVIKTMQDMNKKENIKQKKEKEEKKDNTYLDRPVYFDDDLSTPAMKTIKSALPYVDYKYQKNIGIIIKFMEIQNLLSKYNDTVLMMKKNNDENWHKNMLTAIRPHMKKEKKELIDKIIKFIELKEIFVKHENK